MGRRARIPGQARASDSGWTRADRSLLESARIVKRARDRACPPGQDHLCSGGRSAGNCQCGYAGTICSFAGNRVASQLDPSKAQFMTSRTKKQTEFIESVLELDRKSTRL